MKRYVFDLDNTLVYTDKLNNDSYNHALNLFGLSPISYYKRITRNVIFEQYPSLNEVQRSEIIAIKQMHFINNLENTHPNAELIKYLKSLPVDLCVLWTSGEETRVMAVLEYYQLKYSFRRVVFSDKADLEDDLQRICREFDIHSEHLVFYEDNKCLIEELQKLKVNVVPV